jgi:hypothetical protein
MRKHDKPLAFGLMAVAWLGMILCTSYAIGIQQTGAFLSGQHLSGLPSDWKFPVWSDRNTFYLCCLWVCQMWVLWQLRRIGSVLELHPGVSAQAARAFRGLGHSLVAVAVIGLALPTPHLLELPNNPWMSIGRFDFPTMFEMAIACLCVYTAAHLLDESARLKQENEAFV